MVFLLRYIEGVIPFDGNQSLELAFASLSSALSAGFPYLEFQMQPRCQKASFLQLSLQELLLRGIELALLQSSTS